MYSYAVRNIFVDQSKANKANATCFLDDMTATDRVKEIKKKEGLIYKYLNKYTISRLRRRVSLNVYIECFYFYRLFLLFWNEIFEFKKAFVI